MPAPTDLMATLAAVPEGLTLAEVLQSFPNLARRTAQRRLEGLIADEKVNGIGAGPSRRFHAIVPPPGGTRTDGGFPAGIPVSPDSREVLDYVGQPLSERRPVAYQRASLDDYQPNRSHYLVESIRRQLRRLGDTGQSDLPAGTYGRAVLNRLLTICPGHQATWRAIPIAAWTFAS